MDKQLLKLAPPLLKKYSSNTQNKKQKRSKKLTTILGTKQNGIKYFTLDS